jgi:hypothetical protein
MDFGLKRALTMSSSSLLTGQQLSMQLSSNSSSYSFVVSKLQKSGDIRMELDHMKEQTSGLGYSFPSEVMNDARLAEDSTVKVLFGYFQHPPNMNGINPISPAVSLSLVTEDGDVLNVSKITKRINITIPVSTGELCAGAESNLYAGSVRCLYWDETSSSYRPDGCTAHRISSTQVTCMCTHLTTFVVEPVIPEPNCLPCNKGFFQAAACTNTSHRVCEACVAGKYRETIGGSAEDSCTACGAGKYGVATGQTAEASCTACGAGKYRVETGGSSGASCTGCGAGKYGVATGQTAEAPCTGCGAGKYGISAGQTSEASCTACGAGKYGVATGQTTEASCTACGAGKYRVETGGSSGASCTACVAGKYGVATEQTAESLCTDCGAGKYGNATGQTTEASCTACGAGKYGVAAGQTAEASCTACTPNSNSPSQSSAETDCTCNAGYSGPAGGPCFTLITSETGVKLETFVTLSLSLPFTKDDFTEEKQIKFRESLAVAADVKPADVKIDKIETIGGRRGAGRHLLAGSIRVDTSIRAADNVKASSIVNRLTADNINAELAKVGLPKSTILEAPKVANAVQGEANIVPVAEPLSSNINIAAAAGAGAGVGFVLVLALVFVCVYLQYRRNRIPKDVVEDNVSASVGLENDFVISVQPRPPLSEHRRLTCNTHTHATAILYLCRTYLTFLSLTAFFISLSPPVCVYSGAYQLPALPDSVAITKRLHAFYSRVNPAKAEQV